ncbi:MAG: hypothetical protein OXI73_15810 [Rhodospirillales bacterium]|nr:hypothetical protein [Rhodospirillales bacterium]
MDGSVRFNKAYYPDDIGMARETATFLSENVQRKVRGRRKIFISHKTNDSHAEDLARYITRQHRIVTYLAEWDPTVNPNSITLPDYILTQIRTSRGFLVSVRPQIAISMWVGYEIGVAHAQSVPRAKIVFDHVTTMPTVVEALDALRSRPELDAWIRTNV